MMQNLQNIYKYSSSNGKTYSKGNMWDHLLTDLFTLIHVTLPSYMLGPLCSELMCTEIVWFNSFCRVQNSPIDAANIFPGNISQPSFWSFLGLTGQSGSKGGKGIKGTTGNCGKNGSPGSPGPPGKKTFKTQTNERPKPTNCLSESQPVAYLACSLSHSFYSYS